MLAGTVEGFTAAYHTLSPPLGEGVRVLALAEHWLWPFELNKLDEISDELEAVGKADVRLSECAQGSRGVGGIGMYVMP